MIKDYAFAIKNILSNSAEPNIKALECMVLLLSRLNESQLSDDNSMSNSEEEDFDEFDDIKKIEKNDDKNLKLIQKIYDELFEDQTCIANFVKMLNNDESSGSKYQTIILKILTLS